MTSVQAHPQLHPLLQTQLEKIVEADGNVHLERLAALVSAAYTETDRERRRTERSIALMVEELDHLNSSLESLVTQRTSELESLGRRQPAYFQ